MSQNFKQRYLGLAIVAAIVLALPLVLPNNYYYDVAIRMAINAVIVLGLNLLIGFAGQISLGHAGFLGIGAYATAVLPTHFNIHPLIAMGIGAAIAAVLAGLVARPIFKLKGHYLAMATLGLGIILSIVAKNEALYTGGPDGMPVPPLMLFGTEIYGEKMWYWVVGGLLVGIVEAMAAGYISSAYKDAVPFILILAILFFMPRGLFGAKVTERV